MAGRRWVLEFDGHPPRPNETERMPFGISQGKLRGLVQGRRAARRSWAGRAWFQTQQLGIPPLARIRISAEYRRRNLNVADEDNDRAGLKHIVDGIVRAGVIPRDSRRFLEWGPCTECHGEPAVLVTVEEVCDGDGRGSCSSSPGGV